MIQSQDSSEYLFSEQDLAQLQERGIAPEESQRQIQLLRTGTPFLDIIASASYNFGIMEISLEEKEYYLAKWHHYMHQQNQSVVKFTPASGAASRMFKDLYDISENKPLTETQELFFEQIEKFAFWGALNEVCLRNNWKTVSKLKEQKQYHIIAKNLLELDGLNYGSLPKGLLYFHQYSSGLVRTPVGEHLAEGAGYVQDASGKVRLHFTVSTEHLEHFQTFVDRVVPLYQERYGVIYEVSQSIQNPNTDTLALDADGNPFRTEHNELLFRPGGHGALIDNLNELDAEIVFIKNIDNVLPDYRKSNTLIYKKLLGGILLEVREQVFTLLRKLDQGKLNRGQLQEMTTFLKQVLCIELSNTDLMTDEELATKIKDKLNRPLRVCGMVKNQGEPGGGPFVIREPDGSTSLQILESVQINKQDPTAVDMMQKGAFFNPVDLCCAITDYEGKPFDLHRYVHPSTAFLSEKTKDGKPLIALERPGLWNGAMHHWNTLFVEVPSDTFAPVKTVLDLLRPEHQPMD